MKASFPSPQCSRPPSSRYPCDPECLHDQLQVCPRFGRVGKLQQVLNRRVAHFVLTQGSLWAFHRYGIFKVAVAVADELLRAFQSVARTSEIGVGPFRDLHVFRQGIVERQQLSLMDPILEVAAVVRLHIDDQRILFIVLNVWRLFFSVLCFSALSVFPVVLNDLWGILVKHVK